ncbi:hypothetical protein ATO13_23166 [Stappia sp. 22II-S9-Z10]|nr:hypothetical protein ATO13_23166 [Stappia sp. 22II-S9-Z10]
MTRADRLRDFVASWDDVPVEYGASDCSIVPAIWAARETDKRIEWPDYASEAEAAALVEDAGGLANVWREVAEGAGFAAHRIGAEVPGLGDIGIVDTRTLGQVGGIFANHGLILVRCDPTPDAPRGMRPLSWRPGRTAVAAWRIA